MLQLYVYGEKYKGFLDLSPGTTLNVESLSELFDEELSLGTYSLPVSAPWTPGNQKILGYIEMLNSVPGNEMLYWRCDVWANGITEMTNAKLSLVDFTGSFNYEKGTYSFTIAGNKGLFGSAIAGKTLQDLTLNTISLAGQPARVFAMNVMKEFPGFTQYPFMKFAPVAIENFFDIDRPDYNNEFLAEDIANDIVTFTSGPGTDWEFGRPSSVGGGLSATPGTAEYLDYRTIPFFTYKWILQKIFEEFGYTVSGEWLNDTAWDKAFMFNNFAVEKYDLTTMTDIATVINPVNHLPKKAIGTFLRDMQFFFNVEFGFKDGKQVTIDYRKSALQSKSVMDATGITARQFSGSVPDYKDKGFTLSFAFDNADSYNGNQVKAIDDKQLVATIEKFTDFGSLVIGRSFNFNDLVFVKAENQYFAYSNGSGTGAWEYYSEKLFPMIIGTGGYPYESGISPMVTYLQYDTDIDKLVNKDMVAANMKGSYFNKNYTLVENPVDTRIFYIDKLMKGGVNVPSSFVHNRDRANLLRTPVSLAWDGDEGLYAYLWKDWLNFLMNTRLVTAAMSFNEKSYGNFNNATKIRVAGTYYLVHQSSVILPLQDAASVELYRL